MLYAKNVYALLAARAKIQSANIQLKNVLSARAEALTLCYILLQRDLEY